MRVRYARDFRDDVEALKGILVAAPGMTSGGGVTPGMDTMRGGITGAGLLPSRPIRLLLRCKFLSRQWLIYGWSKGRR